MGRKGQEAEEKHRSSKNKRVHWGEKLTMWVGEAAGMLTQGGQAADWEVVYIE